MNNLIKAALTLAATLICTSNASAARQTPTEIGGTIYDKASGEPLGWTTVALMDKDSSIIAGTTCEADGTYRMAAKPGEYTLTASLLGYKNFSRQVTLLAGSKEKVVIFLEEDAGMLSGATVTERVKLVEMKVDKVVMNISQSAFAQGSNALELLGKAPGVTIDKDGNIKLNGKSVQVWIDGRPSYLDGQSLEAMLRSTGGESIEKFELMEHPSSKYDASGQGGIINIKTKRNTLAGLNGSLGADGGGMYFKDTDRFLWQESSWANLNYRGRKTSTFLNIYEGIYNTDIKMDIDNRLDNAGIPMAITSSSLQKDRYSNWQVRLGNDWMADERNTFGFIVNIPMAHDLMSSDRAHNITNQTIGNTTIERTESDTRNDNRMRQVNTNLNYTHIFDQSRSAELTANLDWYNNTGTGEGITDIYALTDRMADWTGSRREIGSDNRVNIYSAKIDYQTLVAKMFMLETGLKWALSSTDNTTTRIETGLPDRNTEFNYREHIGAAYISASAQLGPKWSLKAGLRGEYTNSFGDWISASDQTRRSYFDLFPTVFAGFTPKAGLNFALSYSRRIQRPSYYALNPAENYIDAHSYTVGDPALKPSYIDEVSLSAGMGQHFALSAGYSHTGDMFSQMPYLKANGDQMLAWANFGRQDMAILTAALSELPITRWFIWTVNANALYMDASTAGMAENRTLSAALYTCLTFNLPSDWKIQLDGRYNSPMAYGFFKIRDQYTANLAVRKNMLDGRLTLTAKLDDIFRTLATNLDCLTAGDESVLGSVKSSYLGQKYYAQSFHIGISWNFGKATGTQRRNVGNIDEASRIGSAKGSGIEGK